MYVADNQLRMIGKAWEVKHQLQKLSSKFGHNQTIAALYMASLQVNSRLRVK